MAEEFVRKDVFDARMDRMEALLEKAVTEMKAEVGQLRAEMGQLRTEMEQSQAGLRAEMGQLQSGLRAEMGQFRAEVRADIGELRGDVRALAAHIEALEFWGAIIIGAAAVFFGLAQYFQSKRETIAAEVKEQVRELRKTVLELVEAGKIASVGR